MRTYDHQEIEKRAQEKWASLGLYQADLEDDSKDPYYLLTEFPYPSGDLHIGHWYAFAVTDIFARVKRMKGENVFFPIGFDAFGLPAENAAIKNKLDPKEWTYKNMERMREQLRSMGASFDWSKEVVTCEPSYYKWTQWLFVKLMEHGLAYRAEASVKWCPKDQTVLANEQVVDGCCERCGTPVEEKWLTQWFLKITDYAERLLKDLEPLPWREEIKEAQRAWVGKSEGAHISFTISGRDEKVKVFTTRPDTLFGATYLVLAPEYPLVSPLLTSVSNKKEAEKYIDATKKKTERERSENKEKTGVKLEGVRAINPANQEEIPVYIADYVLASYGTGAVMAVPAHDERDFAFAKKFDLPIRTVVVPRLVDDRNPHIEGKELVHRKIILGIVRNPKNGKFLALTWKKQPWTTFVVGGIEEGESPEQAARREIEEETGYKNLRFIKVLGDPIQTEFYAAHKDFNRVALDWPVLFELEDEEKSEVSDEEKDKHEPTWVKRNELTRERFEHIELDIVLDRMDNGERAYTGAGVLIASGGFDGKESEEAKWEIVKAVGGERTTNYRLRDWLVSRQRYWGCPIPVVYDPEGAPHAVPPEHLPWLLPTDVDFAPHGEAPLASSKELKKRVEKLFGKGWTPEYDTLDTFVDSSWYFLRYLDPKDENDFSDKGLMKKWLPVDRYSGGSEHTTMHLLYARFFHKALSDLALVPTAEPFNERFNRGLILGSDGQKMSKSKGNVLNPDEFVQKYGADAVRLYLAFIGPYNEPGSYPWSLDGVAAMRKFIDRVVRMVETATGTTNVDSEFIAGKVKIDTERFKFNTAIAALMSHLNLCEKSKPVSIKTAREFIILLAPFAPHLAEHLWEQINGEGSVHQASWPVVNEEILGFFNGEIAVQVNGKKRGSITLSADATEADAVALARNIASVRTALGGKEPQRVVYRPGKILNLVI